MKRKNVSWAPWIALLVVAGAAYGGYRYWNKPDLAVPELRTATVARGDVIQVVTANGSLTPVKSVQVGSQISGTLTKINADFNSQVRAGEIVAQIDPATYERALVLAKAELSNSKAGLVHARLNHNRAKELLSNTLISKAEYDQAEVALLQAGAVVEMREANVERAKVDLDRTTIYAPIDGVVISRNVEEGQTVAASLNTPTLFLIANDLGKMQIEAAVSEADVGGVEEGQTVNFTVDAFPERKFSGTVRQVRYAPTTNQNVITYTTVVAVENRDLKLRPGMTANASIITAESRNVLRIPTAALRFRPPEGIAVLAHPATTSTGTNAPGAASAPLATTGPFAGLPTPPWMDERRRPTEQEREKFEASLTPEQRQKYEEARQRMRSGFGGGGGGGGAGFGGLGGGGSRPERQSSGPRTATLHLVVPDPVKGTNQPALKPALVRLGTSDGANTEVLEGLKEGDVIAIGTVTAASAAAPAPGRPGGSPFGGPRFR